MSKRRSFEMRERRRSAASQFRAERHAQIVASTVRLPPRELAELVAHLPDEVRAAVLAGRATFWRGMTRFELANRSQTLPSTTK